MEKDNSKKSERAELVRITFRTSKDMHAWLKDLSAQTGATMSQVISMKLHEARKQEQALSSLEMLRRAIK